MRCTIPTLAVTAALFGSLRPPDAPVRASEAGDAHVVGRPATHYELSGGLWWNGSGFAPGTLYSVDGVFTNRRPERVDEVIDLDGLWILPPFAEGHTHTIVYVESRIADFLDDGVFYGMVMNAHHSIATSRAAWFDRPDSVDLNITVAALTAADAHPVQIGLRGDATLESIDGDWITAVHSREELAAKWPSTARRNADFVKIFLLYSDEYERRRSDPSIPMRYRGMDPDLVPEIVRLAHRDGLRVAAHVRTAHDFHVAVAAGVDIVAHLPGFSMGPFSLEDAEDPDRLRDARHPELFRIRPEDARRAAEIGARVVTSVGGFGEPLATDSDAAAVVERARATRRAVLTENLTLLREHGVAVVLGSDSGEGSVVTETLVVAELGVFPPSELLAMLVTDTPRMIFPERRIGRLADGHEASFVALAADPLADLAALREVRVRFKQGHPISAERLAALRRPR